MKFGWIGLRAPGAVGDGRRDLAVGAQLLVGAVEQVRPHQDRDDEAAGREGGGEQHRDDGEEADPQGYAA